MLKEATQHFQEDYVNQLYEQLLHKVVKVPV